MTFRSWRIILEPFVGRVEAWDLKSDDPRLCFQGKQATTETRAGSRTAAQGQSNWEWKKKSQHSEALLMRSPPPVTVFHPLGLLRSIRKCVSELFNHPLLSPHGHYLLRISGLCMHSCRETQWENSCHSVPSTSKLSRHQDSLRARCFRLHLHATGWSFCRAGCWGMTGVRGLLSTQQVSIQATVCRTRDSHTSQKTSLGVRSGSLPHRHQSLWL